MWHDYTRKILDQKLKESRKRNPAFSLRAYASKVDMSVSTLSEFLAGKRRLSKAAARKVLGRFELSSSELERLNHLFDNGDSRKELSEEKFSLIANWQYFAILSMFELTNPPKTIGDIATSMRLTEVEAVRALETLRKLNLITKADDWYELTGESFCSSDGVPSNAVATSHLNDFERAKLALREVRVDERDFISLTFVGNTAQIKKAKAEIRKFRDNLYSIMSAKKSDQIYKLSVQLYPLLYVEDKP